MWCDVYRKKRNKNHNSQFIKVNKYQESEKKKNIKEAKVIRRRMSEGKYQRKWKKSHKLKVRNVYLLDAVLWVWEIPYYCKPNQKTSIIISFSLNAKGHLFTLTFQRKGVTWMNLVLFAVNEFDQNFAQKKKKQTVKCKENIFWYFFFYIIQSWHFCK